MNTKESQKKAEHQMISTQNGDWVEVSLPSGDFGVLSINKTTENHDTLPSKQPLTMLKAQAK